AGVAGPLESAPPSGPWATPAGPGTLYPVADALVVRGPGDTTVDVRAMFRQLDDSLGFPNPFDRKRSPGPADPSWDEAAQARPEILDLRLVGCFCAYVKQGFYNLPAKWIAVNILPAFGPAVVPELCDGLDLGGDERHAHRLLAACRAGAHGC